MLQGPGVPAGERAWGGTLRRQREETQSQGPTPETQTKGRPVSDFISIISNNIKLYIKLNTPIKQWKAYFKCAVLRDFFLFSAFIDILTIRKWNSVQPYPMFCESAVM